MNVLIGCEESGIVREEFRKCGHNAYSCDVAPARDNSPYHIQADLNWVLNYPARVLGGHPMLGKTWDLLIAHPPCTYLCNSGVRTVGSTRRRTRHREHCNGVARWGAMHEAAAFFKQLHDCAILRVCLENPVMHPHAKIRKPDQTVQPYQFGDDASKRTGLWLKGLPKLVIPHAKYWVAPRMVNGKPRWSNQTDSGQNKETPSATRARDRGVTYRGIAQAMAEQWGGPA